MAAFGLAGCALVVLLLADGFGAADAPAKPKRQPQTANNLKQLALAFHNYHSTYGCFPPAAIYGKDGKPLLSWRVAILQYLDQKKLYDEFHLDEPWDSENNKKLVERMPKTYLSQFEGRKPGDTVYLAFTGPDTVFDGKKGVKITDISDGTSNTFLFVEAARGVPWTKPEDLPYDANKPLPKFGVVPEGFYACFCDGSVRWVNSTTPEKTLRLLITRNDGQVPGKF
jgi:hypothetical protein